MVDDIIPDSDDILRADEIADLILYDYSSEKIIEGFGEWCDKGLSERIPGMIADWMRFPMSPEALEEEVQSLCRQHMQDELKEYAENKYDNWKVPAELYYFSDLDTLGDQIQDAMTTKIRNILGQENINAYEKAISTYLKDTYTLMLNQYNARPLWQRADF